MSRIASFTFVLGLGLLGSIFEISALKPAVAATDEQARVVYHINDSAGQALAGLRSIRNQLDTDPETNVVVVAHADGIEFLMTDYPDADTAGPLISGLASRGVAFEVCKITMQRKNLKEEDFVMEAQFVHSGVGRITALQNKEGYAYLKP